MSGQNLRKIMNIILTTDVSVAPVKVNNLTDGNIGFLTLPNNTSNKD